MARELTNLEVEQFLDRHPELRDMMDLRARELVYPSDGLAVLDPSGRYVLVWQDFSRVWHFIDLADMTLMQTIANQANAPAYVSDPEYLTLIHEQLGTAGMGIGATVIAAALIVGAALLLRGKL